MRGRGAMLAALLALACGAQAAQSDVHAMFDQAERDGRVGLARKTMPVDVRPARPGEVVVTVIAGEGKETQSPPAQPGDMVVRNRCRGTGNEAILVSAAKFAERYEGPLGRPMQPAGGRTVRAASRWLISSCAPPMARLPSPPPGRADGGAPRRRHRARSRDPADTYRIAAAAFACTYEILRPAP